MKRPRFGLALAAAMLVLACGASSVAPAPPSAGPADAAPEAAASDVDASADAGRVLIVGAERSIAAIRPRLRACYQKGLQRDRKMQGKVVVSLLVASDGSVEKTDVRSNTGLGPDVTACILHVLKSSTFNPPGPGNTAVLDVPVAFFAAEQDAGAPSSHPFF